MVFKTLLDWRILGCNISLQTFIYSVINLQGRSLTSILMYFFLIHCHYSGNGQWWGSRNPTTRSENPFSPFLIPIPTTLKRNLSSLWVFSTVKDLRQVRLVSLDGKCWYLHIRRAVHGIPNIFLITGRMLENSQAASESMELGIMFYVSTNFQLRTSQLCPFSYRVVLELGDMFLSYPQVGLWALAILLCYCNSFNTIVKSYQLFDSSCLFDFFD